MKVILDEKRRKLIWNFWKYKTLHIDFLTSQWKSSQNFIVLVHVFGDMN